MARVKNGAPKSSRKRPLISTSKAPFAGEPEKVAAIIGAIRSKMEGLAKRAEAVLDTLREVDEFFQPAALAAICKLANEYDNPKRRKYEAGLLSLSCKRDRDKSVITMPKGFELPS